MTTLLGGYDLLGDRAYDAAVGAQVNVCHSDRAGARWNEDATALRRGERCVYCRRLMPVGEMRECFADQSEG